MDKKMQDFRAKCAAEALEILEPQIKEGLNTFCVNAFVWGYTEGVLKGYCKVVARRHISLADASKGSGCPEQELRTRMHKYFPDFEC